MGFAIISGSKIIGTTKSKSKKNINKILAREYKKENTVRISKIAKPRKRSRKRK